MSMYDYGFGFDPEVPAGFQDADIEMREFEQAARDYKTPMQCNECGKEFKKRLNVQPFEVKCPKCGGYDTEIS